MINNRIKYYYGLVSSPLDDWYNIYRICYVWMGRPIMPIGPTGPYAYGKLGRPVASQFGPEAIGPSSRPGPGRPIPTLRNGPGSCQLLTLRHRCSARAAREGGAPAHTNMAARSTTARRREEGWRGHAVVVVLIDDVGRESGPKWVVRLLQLIGKPTRPA